MRQIVEDFMAMLVPSEEVAPYSELWLFYGVSGKCSYHLKEPKAIGQLQT